MAAPSGQNFSQMPNMDSYVPEESQPELLRASQIPGSVAHSLINRSKHRFNDVGSLEDEG